MTDLHVSGGAGGITAAYDDIQTEGSQLASLSGTLLGLAGSLEGYLVDGDVTASAALDPAGAARFEGELLSALDGPTGLAAVASGIGAQGLAVQAAVTTYRATDAALADLGRMLDTAAGWGLGKTAPLWAPFALLAGVGVVGVDKALGIDPGKQADALVARNAWIVAKTLDVAPGFVNGLGSDLGLPPLLPTSVPGSAGMLGLLYPDGSPGVAQQDVTARLTDAPRGVRDVLDDAAAAEAKDAVVIRKVEGPNGTAYIVDVAGTNTWNVKPDGTIDHDAVDWTTDVHSLANEQTTYEKGIRAAMAQAGIPKDAPVMLVGHSLGGMVATQTANDLAGSYNVTHVVTAGSPVGNMPLDSSVQSLSLQNDADVVPRLSGGPNPDAPNHTTVTFDSQHDDVGANHSVHQSYDGAASSVDGSSDPSVTRWRDGTDVFFDGTHVTSTQWSITRH